MKYEQVIGILIIIALIAIPFAIAVSNYNECRDVGFSMLYCITTHLVR